MQRFEPEDEGSTQEQSKQGKYLRDGIGTGIISGASLLKLSDSSHAGEGEPGTAGDGRTNSTAERPEMLLR